jgi:hypothetical protein
MLQMHGRPLLSRVGRVSNASAISAHPHRSEDEARVVNNPPQPVELAITAEYTYAYKRKKYTNKSQGSSNPVGIICALIKHATNAVRTRPV